MVDNSGCSANERLRAFAVLKYRTPKLLIFTMSYTTYPTDAYNNRALVHSYKQIGDYDKCYKTIYSFKIHYALNYKNF